MVKLIKTFTFTFNIFMILPVYYSTKKWFTVSISNSKKEKKIVLLILYSFERFVEFLLND